MVHIKQKLSVNSLNINGLNLPVNRLKLSDWILKFSYVLLYVIMT